jgi:flagellar biosynthesis/type III secretory pathway protein FliH
MKKKLLLIIVVGTLILGLCSCERSIYAMEREAKREAAYNKGYEAGFDEGHSEGISDAKESLLDVLQEISWDAEDEIGMSPEEAATTLAHYADGEPVTEEELKQAIWAINHFYWHSYLAINDIDSYNHYN